MIVKFHCRTKEAQEVYEKALFYDSTNPDIYYNVSNVFVIILGLKSLFQHAQFVHIVFIKLYGIMNKYLLRCLYT